MAQNKPQTRECSCVRCRTKRQRKVYTSLLKASAFLLLKQLTQAKTAFLTQLSHHSNQLTALMVAPKKSAKVKKAKAVKTKTTMAAVGLHPAKVAAQAQASARSATKQLNQQLTKLLSLDFPFWQMPSASLTSASPKSTRSQKALPPQPKSKLSNQEVVIFSQPWSIQLKNQVHNWTRQAQIVTTQQLPAQLKRSLQITFIYLTTKNWWAEFSSFKRQLVEEWNEIAGITAKQASPKVPTKPRKGGWQRAFGKLLRKPAKMVENYKKAVRRHVPQFATFIIASILFAVGILTLSYGTYVYVFEDLPEATELVERNQIVTTRILDRNSELLYRIYEDENRTLIPLSSIPQHAIQATIAIEDQEFYQHNGFSARGILRAFVANLEGKQVQGGSTITQQLVKNRLLSPEKTLRRKIREVLLAIVVDGTYTKEQILEMYFNQVAYGGATYGIEEAAQTYFGKPATQLTLAESAMLAGLPAAPSVYNPFGPNPEFAYARQHEVLRRMVDEQFITQEQADAAKDEILQFRNNVVDIKAPHFVMYVKKLLAEQYGEEVLNQGGLEVRTTLDLELQNATQEIVTKEMESLARLRINNGAALVTNPKTGEVLSMVGSKNYFDFENDGQVNVTIRPRQPGSSIKPLTYAVAMERGKTPYSIIDDSPITYNIAGSPPYSPKNYDGKFHGKVTLRQSLGSSYNIPAVKLLAEVGINTVIDKAQAIGVSSWNDRNRFGLSLTLGGGEVMMTELAQIYGTFANNGYTEPLNPILEVKNSKGEVLYRNTCALDGIGCIQERNFDPRIAYQITDILKDNNARTPAFGPRSVLHIPGQEVAVKTGTTNNLRDNWTIGYTSDVLVAVWVGNNDNTPMSYVASGVTGASPIWNNIIRLTLDDTNPHKFSVPDGLVKVNICERTGTLTCSGCPRTIEAYYVAGTEPKQACNPAQFRPKPKASPNPTDPNRDMILEGAAI